MLEYPESDRRGVDGCQFACVAAHGLSDAVLVVGIGALAAAAWLTFVRAPSGAAIAAVGEGDSGSH